MKNLLLTICLIPLFLACLAAPALAQDCNSNGLDDACDLDCGALSGACDLPGCGLSADCDSNMIPDECDMAIGASGCRFPVALHDNGTTAPDATFVGPPDDVSYGLGDQQVTFDLTCGFIVDGPGPDFTIYEADSGTAEFDSLYVAVSQDGIFFEGIHPFHHLPAVNIPGDEAHGSNDYARSYDLGLTHSRWVRYVRLWGDYAGAPGPTAGFELDAIGVINRLGRDCDSSGTLDACEPLADCDDDDMPDSCYLAENLDPDCNSNGTIDMCDVLSLGSHDCDSDYIPDECESDCNSNGQADECDIAGGLEDCNSNSLPDVCDITTTSVNAASGPISPVGFTFSRLFSVKGAYAADSDVTLSIDAIGDFDDPGEYITVKLNGTQIATVLTGTRPHCALTSDMITIDKDLFNELAPWPWADFEFVATSDVSPVECIESTIYVTVQYDPIIDCNTNNQLDKCDIMVGYSDDLNQNGIADECESDCNSNGVPDDYDIEQGTSLDCNSNGVPDECDTASGSSLDCNANTIPDECDLASGSSLDCNTNEIPDECEADCDANGIPDDCDMALGASGCPFTFTLSENTTTGADSIYVGPPDDTFYGLGGQIVTYEFDCGLVIDGPGPDITVYEIDSGTAEFNSMTVWVSQDGVTFFNIDSARFGAINIPGDETHGSNSYARSYDLDPSGLTWVRYVRIDGDGTGGSGSNTGFDLDAIGAVNRLGLDCDSSGALDACEALDDCDSDGVPDNCYLVENLDPDCNSNGTIDRCDVGSMASLDCDSDFVPDECEPDCNSNGIADDCDIASGFSDDCNLNLVPDSCDMSLSTFFMQPDPLSPVGYDWEGVFTIQSAFPAASDVTLTVDAVGDFDAANEYLDVYVNGTNVGRVLDTATTHCTSAIDSLIIPAAIYNSLGQGVDVWIHLIAPSTVSTIECIEPTVTATLQYDPIIDCNSNGALDYCDIFGGGSTDLNLNGIADDCEEDCNSNAAPDDYDIYQGTSADCNSNDIPDECDTAAGSSLDCNSNSVPDECEVDCNSNGVPDDCDIVATTSPDCDANWIPDECDMHYGADGCAFPVTLSGNTTGADDSRFTGPPDDVYYGLGGQIVTYEFDCGFALDGPGVDITVYELDSGTPEFNLLADVLVSEHGIEYHSIKSTETTAVVNIPGDESHGSNSYARSYDLAASGLVLARFIRLDGSGTGSAGPSTGFDLDAVGAVNRIGRDCDSSGILDLCEPLGDCDSNLLPDVCELPLEGDCNTNGVPDDCDLAGSSTDCNHNGLLDECDIGIGTSLDCNSDGFPDECPDCRNVPVEVSFVMDVSDSMDDEGEELCGNINRVVADLHEDLVNVDEELMAIMNPGTGIYDCLNESVANKYGTTVPGSPPPENAILGDCPGGLQSPTEDWGRAVSVTAWERLWANDAVRLVVPLSDEGTWCGDPTTDPGVDRDALVNAIWSAQTKEVVVSPVTCSGSSAAVIGMAQQLADQTGGERFASSLPAEDLVEGLKMVIYEACDAVTDCNHNNIPDECELDAGILEDCDSSGRPDICEADCNGNGYHDSCDIAWGTSFDANANSVPDECEAIQLTLDTTDLFWTAVDGAVGYDVVRGDLIQLMSMAGDFSLSTDVCMANDHATLTAPHSGDPALSSEQGYWYLVRGVLGTLNLGYETFAGSQEGWRDGEILASGVDCP